MTVAELRAALAALPAEADGWDVVLSLDPWGHDVRPADEATTGTWHERRPEPAERFVGGHPDGRDGPCSAVCLWPAG